MNLYQKKLEKIFHECDKHILRIVSATNKMSNSMPLDENKYLNLTDDEVEHIDQFLFRFAKLQDAMGEKLFKTILLFLDENIENKPFIDILNRLEKLELIESANIWRELRSDRNDLSHTYDDESEEMANSINKLYEKKDILIEIYRNIKRSVS